MKQNATAIKKQLQQELHQQMPKLLILLLHFTLLYLLIQLYSITYYLLLYLLYLFLFICGLLSFSPISCCPERERYHGRKLTNKYIYIITIYFYFRIDVVFANFLRSQKISGDLKNRYILRLYFISGLLSLPSIFAASKRDTGKFKKYLLLYIFYFISGLLSLSPILFPWARKIQRGENK